MIWNIIYLICILSSIYRHLANPVFLLILHPREIQALWSQTYQTEMLVIDGQGGGGGPLAVFLRVSDFCSMTSNRLVGDTYVALVDSQRGGKGGHT